MSTSGDESAIQAIAAALEALPGDAVARVVLVESAAHEPQLVLPAGGTVTFVHRDSAVEWLDGLVHAFVHGEAEEVMRGVRP
jgi:NADPH-dependent ferric siderophore reductase